VFAGAPIGIVSVTLPLEVWPALRHRALSGQGVSAGPAGLSARKYAVFEAATESKCATKCATKGLYRPHPAAGETRHRITMR
jgi:hypothetical protein